MLFQVILTTNELLEKKVCSSLIIFVDSFYKQFSSCFQIASVHLQSLNRKKKMHSKTLQARKFGTVL